MNYQLKKRILQIIRNYDSGTPNKQEEVDRIIGELNISLEYFTVNELHRDDLIEYGFFNFSDEDMQDIANKLGESTPYWDSMCILNDTYKEFNIKSILIKLNEYFNTEKMLEIKKYIEENIVVKKIIDNSDFWNCSFSEWKMFESIINDAGEVIKEKENSNNMEYLRCKFLISVCHYIYKWKGV
jgi:hypothetical protein